MPILPVIILLLLVALASWILGANYHAARLRREWETMCREYAETGYFTSGELDVLDMICAIQAARPMAELAIEQRKLLEQVKSTASGRKTEAASPSSAKGATSANQSAGTQPQSNLPPSVFPFQPLAWSAPR